jgi:hypothetical protein
MKPQTLFILFKGFVKIAEYTTFDMAKTAITGVGIWNICECQIIDDRITIINRTPIKINSFTTKINKQ